MKAFKGDTALRELPDDADQVDDRIAPCRPSDAVSFSSDISAEKLKPSGYGCFGMVIQQPQGVTPGTQLVTQMSANETGSAADEYFHVCPLQLASVLTVPHFSVLAIAFRPELP
jgi:hypothetical protein